MASLERITGLAPVYGKDARLLILGSMPGNVSLRAGAYYAHPRNAFWKIIYEFYGEKMETDPQARYRFAVGHRIALWDSAGACLRAGSLDSAMREVEINDFALLFAECPHLRAIACNGARAYALFMKSGYAGRLPVMAMPSTSPAYAAMSEEEKAARWANALVWTRGE